MNTTNPLQIQFAFRGVDTGLEVDSVSNYGQRYLLYPGTGIHISCIFYALTGHWPCGLLPRQISLLNGHLAVQHLHLGSDYLGVIAGLPVGFIGIRLQPAL